MTIRTICRDVIKMPFDKIYPFSERAVAFLDVLGFSQLIQEAERLPHKRDELFGIITTLDAHARFNNNAVSSEVPNDAKPKYIFISDSIIFSTPLQHGKYEGLAVLVAKSIQIAHKLRGQGYLLQGAISVGSVWHMPTNIFGTGYIDAWRAQESLECPHVILTETAATYWNDKLKPLIGNLCLPVENGQWMLDLLDPYYIQGNGQIHGVIDQTFAQYRAIIVQRLAEFKKGSSPDRKWRWMATFFNDAIKRHGITCEQVIL